MAVNLAHPYNRRRVLAIDNLPDDVLLEIFDFCVVPLEDSNCIEEVWVIQDSKKKIEPWQSLVHVCRRWRGLVFGSPRRLDLQLDCTIRTFSRRSLDVWPALPLLIKGRVNIISVNEVIAGLDHHTDRIRQIHLFCHTTPQIEKLWTVMQVPFPELVALNLSVGKSEYDPKICPDSFLGGSAPRLRYFSLDAIPFPGLPKLLLSTTHLVELRLLQIPHSGYISPEAMVICLSMLTSLKTLQLEFDSLESYPDFESRHPFLATRSVLPTLTIFSFKGVNEYLEEFVARLDTPQLSWLSTAFLNYIDFNTPELNQFISRTPILRAYDEAHLIYPYRDALVRLRQSDPEQSDLRMVQVTILGDVLDQRGSYLAKICTLLLRLLLTVENLYIDIDPSSVFFWASGGISNTELLDLLLPFTAVKNLYISKLFLPRIADALLELAWRRTTEVLPALQNVLLEGFQPSEPVQEGIAQFISARQLINHPVAISVWNRDRNLL